MEEPSAVSSQIEACNIKQEKLAFNEDNSRVEKSNDVSLNDSSLKENEDDVNINTNSRQFKKLQIKRIKHLFLIFLRKFDIDEYHMLLKFLKYIVKKYSNNSDELIEFLKSHNHEISLISAFDTSASQIRPKFPKSSSASSNLGSNGSHSKRAFLTESSNLQGKFSEFKKPILKYKSLTNLASDPEPTVAKKKNLSLTNIKTEEIDSSFIESSIDLDQIQNKSEIIESFILKEEEQTDTSFQDFEEDYTSKLNSSSFIELDESTTKSKFRSSNRTIKPNKNYFNDENINLNEVNLKLNHPSKPNKAKGNIYDSNMRIRKFSDQITNELEQHFLKNNFISGSEKAKLAKKLSLTERQVQKWFVHRREKLRRLQKRATNIQNVIKQQTRPNLDESSSSEQLNSSSNTVKYGFARKKLATAKKSTFNRNSLPNLNRISNEETSVNKSFENNSTGSFNDSELISSDNLSSDQLGKSRIKEEKSEIKQRSNLRRKSLIEKQMLKEIEQKKRVEETSNKKQVKRHMEMDEGEEDQLPSSKRSNGREFPPDITNHLESVFEKTKYIDEGQLVELSESTGLTGKQIKAWFKQKRFKYNLKYNGKADKKGQHRFKFAYPESVRVELEKEFERTANLNDADKKRICSKLGLKPIELERWYYFKRRSLNK